MLNKTVRRLGQVVCLTATLLILGTGCGGNGEGGGNAATGGGKKFITIGTATSGGVYAQVGNAITNVIEAEKGDLNWNVTALETKGTQENIRKLAAGEVEFGMSNAAIAFQAFQGGNDKWKEKQEIRSVGTLAPNIAVFIALKSSGLQSMSDLKGKRVVLGPPGAGFEAFLEPILGAHGVSYEDLDVKHGSFLAAKDLLTDGGADAAFMGGVPPNGIVSSLCETNEVVFLDMNTDLAESLKEFPFFAGATIKANVYSDLEKDLSTVNCGSMQLITHANVDEDTVYEMTKLFYEQRTKIAEIHPAGKAINPKNVIRDVGIPFHPGAIKFYKEAGIWPGE